MLIRAKAPLRISFAGGGTDVPPFPQQEGGCVLNATINRYAWGTLRPRADRQVHVESLDFGVSIRYALEDKLVYDGKLDLAKAAIMRFGGNATTGFDLFLHSDAPPGSGLGASSAMMVVLVGLLKELNGLPLTDYQIADVAYVLERTELGIQGGLQDQYAAAFGGFNYMEFLADRVVVNPLKVSSDIVNELGYNLLLCYTGTMRLSARIIEDQVRSYQDTTSDAYAALRELKQITVEMKNLLLRRQLDDFGALLHEEWLHKRRMSSRISTPEIDELYERARELGALGGKITGAGGGGYMLLYCPYDRKHRIAEAMESMGCTIAESGFELAGLQTWRTKSDAARAVRTAA